MPGRKLRFSMARFVRRPARTLLANQAANISAGTCVVMAKMGIVAGSRPMLGWYWQSASIRRESGGTADPFR